MERTKSTAKKTEVESTPVEVQILPVEPKPAEDKIHTEIEERPKLQYKLKAGKLYIFGKKFTTGQVFDAYPEQIPKAFKDSLICLSPPEVQQMTEDALFPKVPKDRPYEVVPSKSPGWFHVINKITGKQLTEKAKRKDEAEQLCESLNE